MYRMTCANIHYKSFNISDYQCDHCFFFEIVLNIFIVGFSIKVIYAHDCLTMEEFVLLSTFLRFNIPDDIFLIGTQIVVNRTCYV